MSHRNLLEINSGVLCRVTNCPSLAGLTWFPGHGTFTGNQRVPSKTGHPQTDLGVIPGALSLLNCVTSSSSKLLTSLRASFLFWKEGPVYPTSQGRCKAWMSSFLRWCFVHTSSPSFTPIPPHFTDQETDPDRELKMELDASELLWSKPFLHLQLSFARLLWGQWDL